MIRTAHPAVVMLALAAMVLRALTPVGWMPGAAGAPITLCSADGPIHLVVGEDGKPHKPQKDDGHQVCPFAAASHFAPPQLAVALAPRAVVFDAADPISATTLLVEKPRLFSHAPRAPPLPV